MKEQKITKYLKLPFQFDKEKLARDLSLVLENKWIPHFNTGGYEGEWNVISLMAPGGNESNIFAISPNNSLIEETQLLKHCNYFKHVIDSFEFPILTARILCLGVGAEIKPHTDHKLGYENDTFRLHIPISTNDNVKLILDGQRLEMRQGECWYTNVNYVHSVSNHGTTDRVHLVIDGKRNTWSDDLFFSLAPKESFFPVKKEIYSSETILKMIEELKRSDLPVAKQLILELQQKLNKT